MIFAIFGFSDSRQFSHRHISFLTMEDEDDSKAKRRRQDESDLAEMQFILYSALAYQEYGLGNFLTGAGPREVIEHRHNKRSRRRLFHPEQTREFLLDKYYRPDPRTGIVNHGKTFAKHYRISMQQFMRIMEVFGAKGDPYWTSF